MTSNLYRLIQLARFLSGLSLALATTASLRAQTTPYSLFQRHQTQAQPQGQQPVSRETAPDDCIDCIDPRRGDQEQQLQDADVPSRKRSGSPSLNYRSLSPTYGSADPRYGSDRYGPDRDQRDNDTSNAAMARDRVIEPPTEFQRFVRTSTGRLLPIFGSTLFERVPSTFAPTDRVPTKADYIVGPGDEIELRVWGQLNFSERFIVDAAGDIFLPQVGRISVSGVKFAQLREILQSALARVYRNFDLNVNMGQLRSMQIFVLGQARRPGVP